jgi:hypothetical protein
LFAGAALLARENHSKQENNGSGVIAWCQIVRFVRCWFVRDVLAGNTG